jgi:hypothetical protein
MQHYRAFQLDDNGHVIGSVDLSCLNDEDARKQAEQLLKLYDIELWQLDRRVAVLKSEKTRNEGIARTAGEAPDAADSASVSELATEPPKRGSNAKSLKAAS